MKTENAEEQAIPGGALSRAGLLTFTAAITFFYCGAFLGWGPMQLMLEGSDAFAWKCEEDEDLPCSEQSKTLVTIPMIAYSCAVVFSPALGYLSDSFGPLALMSFLGFSGCLGISLIVVASATGTDYLHFVGFTFFGLMFVSVSIIIQPTGLVFRGAARRRVISVLHALIDAGSSTFLILYGILEATRAFYSQIMSSYLVLAVICFGGGTYFWWKVSKTTNAMIPAEDKKQSEFDASTSKVDIETPPTTDECSNDNEEAADDSHSEALRKGSKNANSMIPSEDTKQSDTDASASKEDTEPPPMTDERPNENIEATDDSKALSGGSSHTSDTKPLYTSISKRKPMEQLKSLQFLLVLVFFMFHVARANFTLMVARDFLGSLGDDETGNKYLTIFSVLNAASLLGIPFIDWVLAKFGYATGFQLVNLLAFIHGVIQVFTDNLNVQIIGFVIYSFYRCYLFSVVFSFLPMFLSGNVVGRASGIMFVFTAAFATINIGFSSLAVNRGMDFFLPNLLYLVCVVPMGLIAWGIQRGIQREVKCNHN